MFGSITPFRGNCAQIALAVTAGSMFFACLGRAQAGLTLGTVTWDGDCGNTIWNSQCGIGGGMTNWNDDNIPTLGDDVALGAADPVITLPGVGGAAASLSCLSGISITSSGSLELGGNSTIHNLSMNSTSIIGLRIQGGDVLLETACGWVQGRMTGAGSVKNRGMMTGSPDVRDTVMFFNQATADLSTLTIGASALAINGTGADMTLGNAGGLGTFTNLGTLTFAHQGNSTYTVGCPFVQHDGGTLVVSGTTTGEGTRFTNDATFDGGELFVVNGGRLRFQDIGGVGAVYTFNGLPAITGDGNMSVETPINGDWRVEEQGLEVNLNGADGFVMNSTYLTLNGVLTNQGKARWATGRLREGGDGLAPEFRNEGSLTIYTSGVRLDTFLSNEGTIVHEVGGLALGDDGVVVNFGTYEHRRGGIARAFGAVSGSFSNHGAYKRPNHPGTQDETIQGPFVHNPGATARYEKATTTYTAPGLFMLGGDVIVEQGATLRASTAEAQNATTNISGTGQFRIEGFGGNGSFLVTEPGVTVRTSLSNASGGGFVLGVGGRIGGPGKVRNINDMTWTGGTVGLNGAGRLENDDTCILLSGIVNQGGVFKNEFDGAVTHSGTFSLNSGMTENEGFWTIIGGSGVQGSGTHEFKNLFDGIFRCSVEAGQTATVSARFNNLGEVHADSGTLQFTGTVVQIIGTTLTGGDWVVDYDATLNLPGTLTEIGPDVGIACQGDWPDLESVTLNLGQMLRAGGEFDNSRVINMGGMSFDPFGLGLPTNFQGGNGTVENNPPPPPNSTLGYMDTPIVPVLTGRGDGEIPFALRCGNLNNRSLVRPGGPDVPGPFKMDGNFNQFPTGMLQIELAGSAPVDEHDQLIVDGNVALDGTLQVKVLPGYAPEGGEEFTIITATNGTISGQFDQIIGPGQYTLAYSPTSVVLKLVTPPVAGDITNNGVVNVDDLLAVINGWGSCPIPCPPACAADIAPSGGNCAVNVDDLLMVINNWG